LPDWFIWLYPIWLTPFGSEYIQVFLKKVYFSKRTSLFDFYLFDFYLVASLFGFPLLVFHFGFEFWLTTWLAGLDCLAYRFAYRLAYCLPLHLAYRLAYCLGYRLVLALSFGLPIGLPHVALTGLA
jgi:hypothetical protein